jgi:hypothetical protein
MLVLGTLSVPAKKGYRIKSKNVFSHSSPSIAHSFPPRKEYAGCMLIVKDLIDLSYIT